MIIWVQNDMGILFLTYLLILKLINCVCMFFVHMYHLYLALRFVLNPLPRGHYSQTRSVTKAWRQPYRVDSLLTMPSCCHTHLKGAVFCSWFHKSLIMMINDWWSTFLTKSKTQPCFSQLMKENWLKTFYMVGFKWEYVLGSIQLTTHSSHQNGKRNE